MPERRRRTRRSRSGSSSGDSGLSALIPNILERPVGAAIGGVGGFTGNLLTDVKDAVVGLPMGLVSLAKDPIKSSEAIAGSVWHTWSPLFKGDFEKFAKQTYDHPLAPILDVASVFTLGAGTAARSAGALSKAGSTSTTVARVAGLRTPKTRALSDPTGAARADIYRPLSNRAGRRLMQESIIKLDNAGKLPQWYTRARYERGYLGDMAHRATVARFIESEAMKRAKEIESAVDTGDLDYLAARLQGHAILEGGKALEDITELGKRARTAVITHMQTNLIRHNRAYDRARASQLLKSGHYVLARDPAFMDTKYLAALDKAGRAHARTSRMWSNKSDRHAADVEKWTRIRDEAEAAGTTLRRDEAVAKLDELSAFEQSWRNRIQEKYDTFEALRNRATEDYLRYAGDTYESMERTVANFGRHATTRKFEHAAMDADGNFYVVPKHDAYNLGYEGGNSLKLIHKLIHKPTQMWKAAILGYTPRIVVNNGVGNWFLYMSRELPSGNGALAFYDAMRFSLPSKAAGEALFPKNHWLYRYFSDEMADAFGSGTMGIEGYSNRLSGVKGRLKRGFYPATAAVSERPLRAAALYKALRDMPEVQAAIKRAKKQGKGVDYGIEQALAGTAGQQLRDYAAQQSRRLGGDYVTLSESEKFARDIIPFYLWNRHILKTTGNMLLDQPGRLAIGSRISDFGIEQTEEMLGELPEFLKGAIPLAALGFGDKPGRANIFLTASLNPFATVGELAETMAAYGPGTERAGAAFSQFNPFLTASIEHATGTSLLTGKARKVEGGLLGGMLEKVIEGLPLIKIPEALATPDTSTTPVGGDYMFAKDDLSPISSALGLGIRNLSLDAAGGGSSSGRRRRRRRRSG